MVVTDPFTSTLKKEWLAYDADKNSEVALFCCSRYTSTENKKINEW